MKILSFYPTELLQSYSRLGRIRAISLVGVACGKGKDGFAHPTKTCKSGEGVPQTLEWLLLKTDLRVRLYPQRYRYLSQVRRWYPTDAIVKSSRYNTEIPFPAGF